MNMENFKVLIVEADSEVAQLLRPILNLNTAVVLISPYPHLRPTP